MKTLIAGLAILAAATLADGQTVMPKYRVTVKADKHTDFASLRTYAWDRGMRAPYESTHERVVAAVDREMAALGFTQVTDGKSDVLVTYVTLRRTDVDLKAKSRTPDGMRPSYPVATLLVLLRDPGTLKELYRARVDTPIELDEEKLAATIDDRDAQMFARYPTRRETTR